jgi:ubiquinone/menaquinone biosynthesis C-methylase UbiE
MTPHLAKDRTARSVYLEASFFLKHVRPEMHVLDCGCGPGSITLGLARHADKVVGLDRNFKWLEIGQREAVAQRVSNATFEEGDVEKGLRFQDSLFDAVLLHAVLYHLKSPDKALKEILRVLKPGGVLGVRDLDIERNKYLQKGQNPLLDRALKMSGEFTRLNGGNPSFGPEEHRNLLERAGFEVRELLLTWDKYQSGAGSDDCEDISVCGEITIESLQVRRSKILENGWATEAEVQSMTAALEAWHKRPDAWFHRCRPAAVAEKPGRLYSAV